MKKFTEWVNEVHYDPHFDGPALKPHTISAAENQIRWLATQIRQSFNQDQRFRDHHDQIFKACQLLDQAADIIGDTMMAGDQQELRGLPHKFA